MRRLLLKVENGKKVDGKIFFLFCLVDESLAGTNEVTGNITGTCTIFRDLVGLNKVFRDREVRMKFSENLQTL